MRFQTADLNASIEAYPQYLQVLQHAQVSHATDGALHNDPQEYDWPLENLSLQAQCEQLLSTKIWSARTQQRDEFLTLEALTELFGSGEEWRPYNMDTSNEYTREHIVHFLRDYQRHEHPLADLYDIRLVPMHSSFCDKKTDVYNAGPTLQEITNFEQDMQGLLGDVEDIFPDEQFLLHWSDTQSASVGSLPYACPCLPVNYPHGDGANAGCRALCARSRI